MVSRAVKLRYDLGFMSWMNLSKPGIVFRHTTVFVCCRHPRHPRSHPGPRHHGTAGLLLNTGRTHGDPPKLTSRLLVFGAQTHYAVKWTANNVHTNGRSERKWRLNLPVMSRISKSFNFRFFATTQNST